MLNAGDNKSAAELSAGMIQRAPRSAWRYVAVLLSTPDDPAKAAQMLPQAADSDLTGALLGLAAARQAGNATPPWADRVAQLDAEMTKAQPARGIAPTYNVLSALANGNVKRAEAEAARFQSASIVGKNVAAELIAYAASDPAASTEAAGLIRATVATDLGLPIVARGFALDVLTKRPESQWAAALVIQSSADAATRRRVLDMLRPKDCVVAKMIQAAQAAEDKNYAAMAGIYRSIADVEKENQEVLARLALAETLAGNVEKAVTLHQKIWQDFHDATAANNGAYLMAQLWPQDKAKLAEAETLIEAAIKAQPSIPAYLETAGWIAHLRGDDARALRLLREAVKGLPDSIEAHAHLGIVEAASGNKPLASWHLTSAVKNAERLKARGENLGPEQLQGLQLAQKALSELGQPGP